MTKPTAMNGLDRNIADALADHMAKPQEFGTIDAAGGGRVRLLAIPEGFKLEKFDDHDLLASPRRAKTSASLATPESFLDYVRQHATQATKVWCNFNPQTFALSFTAVIDDHHEGTAGWRQHLASYTPMTSTEWKVWTGHNEKPLGQVDFATFLERNADDINTGTEGTPPGTYPSSLDMLTMATQFEINGDKRVKSVVRLQSGGVRFDLVDDEDEATRTQMQAFEKFMVGIPVFWAGTGYRIESRLKYRNNGGKLSFWYELIRPDRVHEAAAKDLIGTIRMGLSGDGEGLLAVPLLMGDCK